MRIFSTSIGLVFITTACFGQNILFEAGFDDPSVFTLNTTDAGSTATGANTWMVNAVYTGGSGIADCAGFELPFTIPGTAGQPVGISGPNGNYLHTASTAAVSSGILCCSFGAADGFCTDPGNHFARMSNDISTVGEMSVSLSFWWLCQGGAQNYGEVYYSLDGGTVWSQITTPIAQYSGTSSWTQQTITIPAFSGQPTLRFGFRFFNGVSLFGAADPGFAVDDVRITSDGSLAAAISGWETPSTSFCVGATFQVAYSVVGAFSSNNQFRVELSDASGSFASAEIIGVVLATGSGSISCTIPAGLPAGTGYRLRVTAIAPAAMNDLGAGDITIDIPPSAGADATVSFCTGEVIDLFAALGGMPDACGTWTDPLGAPTTGFFDPASSINGAYSYTTNCPGACPQDQAAVVVGSAAGPGAGNDVEVAICSNTAAFTPYAFIDGGATTGQFLYNGQPFPLPDFTLPGSYGLEYVVQGSQPCPNDTAELVFEVIGAPDAGASLTYTTCITTPPFELVDLLIGAEQDGSWTDPSGEDFGGLLDPASDISGLYTYTVEGDGPCASDQAFVALVIDPCSGILERSQERHTITWLGQQGQMHHLALDGTDPVTHVVVVDASGRAVGTVSVLRQGEQLVIDLDGASTGLYTIIVHRTTGMGTARLVHHVR